MTVDAALEDEPIPDAAPFAALAFLAPWALVSVFLPDPWRMASLALVAALAILLLGAAAWSRRYAERHGLDANEWAFLAVLTAGFSMVALLARASDRQDALTLVCIECGHQGHVREPFCYGCGAA